MSEATVRELIQAAANYRAELRRLIAGEQRQHPDQTPTLLLEQVDASIRLTRQLEQMLPPVRA